MHNEKCFVDLLSAAQQLVVEIGIDVRYCFYQLMDQWIDPFISECVC